MDFIPESISNYAELHTKKEDAVLMELNRETWTKVLRPRMLSGHLQGKILEMFSKMINPEKILEIGTYTGYSAICLAKGLKSNGILHTIDINDELEELIDKYIKNAGLTSKIKLHIGNAMEVIPTLSEKWDLVFIDADKENYSNYYNLVFENVKPGGYIIADNVLWSGKVLGKYEEQDEETKAIMDFNLKIQEDHRIENVLLPVRDGLMVIRKK